MNVNPAWKLRPAAREDLAQLWQEGAARWGADQADSYLDAFLTVFDLLARFPQLARLRPEFTPPVHIHPHGSHLVVYLPVAEGAEAAGIDILRLLHAHQNLRDYLAEG